MSKKHQYILRKNGIDADRYLSMRIDKESIPDGAEVVIQIKDKDTGELRTVPVSTAFDGYFGKNSRFYMQVMNDGHVFNPYIHRRFLPAQFQRNIRTAGYNGIHNYVREQYSWNYVVRFLKEECAKLDMLQRRDPEAFRERSQFLITSAARTASVRAFAMSVRQIKSSRSIRITVIGVFCTVIKDAFFPLIPAPP